LGYPLSVFNKTLLLIPKQNTRPGKAHGRAARRQDEEVEGDKFDYQDITSKEDLLVAWAFLRLAY